MNFYSNELYMKDVVDVGAEELPWEKLQDKRVMISGATGLIGSFLVDVILEKNNMDNLNCTVYLLGRDENKAKKRFSKYIADKHFVFFTHDVRSPLNVSGLESVDYIFHLASNTHPMQYSTDPIGTITTNIIGLQNMLDFAVKHNTIRFVFASSNEVYGENRGDVEFFGEKYCGYIDSNTLRAGYPESKRCGEALCQAYKSQTGLNVVIPRLTRTYGPTMLMSDTKAISQFIKKGISDEDIILKSDGNQFFSYTYMADAVCGLLTILLKGEDGEAYNIADEHSDIMLKDLAELIAVFTGRKVVFEIPSDIEAAGYSTATKARLNGKKLKAIGWKPRYDIKSGIQRTIEILKQSN